jgi:type I restriction enzyme, S subunit
LIMVPPLRYRQFEEDWAQRELQEVCEKKISYGIVQAGAHIPDGMPYIKSTDLNGMLNSNDLQRTSNEIARKYRRSEVGPGDVVFSLRGNLGVTRIVPKSLKVANLTQGTARISTKGCHSSQFIHFALQAPGIGKNILTTAKGSTFQEISLVDLRRLKINLPSLPEQQKIASFLSAVDKKIQQLTCKKELLEEYKKGVMQKLFPSAGSGQSPEIRFKDENGEEFPEWEEKRLGDIIVFVRTNSFSRSQLSNERGQVKNIHYGDIHKGLKTSFRASEEELPFIKEEVDISSLRPDGYIGTGDLVIADASEDYDDIGKAIEIRELNTIPIVAGLHTFLARDSTNNIAEGFKGHIFQTWLIRHQLMKIAQGISVLGISKKNLSEVEFFLPVHAEQKLIVGYLDSLSTIIWSTKTQISQLQLFKKGLLQQMFV